ncbi:MAG TPA: UPF0175 family protein [Thermoanaerobaculia bacterium]|nr:UPF0175 family protein [Thermoanaerobaculia bacterium]
MKAKSVRVDLPEEALRGRSWDAQAIARDLRLLWLLEEVRARRLGFAKAAELAGVPQAKFLGLMGQHNITPFDYDADELVLEFRRDG